MEFTNLQIRFWKSAWWTRTQVPSFILNTTRMLNKYSNLTIMIITGFVVVIAWKEFNLESSGLATILYATILFLGAIFRTDRPYPVITQPRRRVHSDYAIGEDELGFKYTFNISNLGNKPLHNPRIEYWVVNRKYRKQKGWTNIQAPSNKESSLISPGETVGPFEIKKSGIRRNKYDDLHIAVRVLPRDGNWALGRIWTVSIGSEAGDSSQ